MVSINLKDFCNLVGKDLSIDFLRDRLPFLGTAWERASEEEFEVEVFPNRPDMFSTEGLARAFAGFINHRKGIIHFVVEPSDYKTFVDGSVRDVRPYIVVSVVEGVRLTEEGLKSIMQLQEKLHISFGRNRRKASIGIYDADKVRFPLSYTTRDQGFEFQPLDFPERISIAEILRRHPKGREYAFILQGFDRYPILMDSLGTVLSMPPIINSEDTRVTPSSRNLVIDVTGLDYRTINAVLNIVTCSLVERGGKVRAVSIYYPYATEFGKSLVTPDLSPRRQILKISSVRKLTGLKIGADEIRSLLEAMRFGVEKVDGDTMTVLVPPYRADIMHEVDLVEDVAIAYGYDRILPEIPPISTIGGEDPMEVFSSKIRELMIGFGYQEVMTYILTNPTTLFKKMRLPETKDLVELRNPKTSEYTVCRNWLLPSLLEVLSRNTHRTYPQRIFEVDDVIEPYPKAETKARSLRKLALVTIHNEADFAEVRALCDALFHALGLRAEVLPSDHPSFLEGRYGMISLKGMILGFLGEVHPEVLEAFGLEHPAAAMELDLERIREFCMEIRSS
ncbi:phenylalanine--tRNA ligase subunit beta [Candidatus Bathyarchaeota archaeon]|nr:phenylalanine--tRNA ligase subunit beta [Candidatus Bathyarchaeota archaeon]